MEQSPQSKASIRVYSKTLCPFCDRAKALLKSLSLDFEEINLDHQEPGDALRLFEKTGFRTVPQIFIGEECIGGFDDLQALYQSGELQQKLGKTS